MGAGRRMCGFPSHHESFSLWDRHPEAVASARKVEAHIDDEGGTLPVRLQKGRLGPCSGRPIWYNRFGGQRVLARYQAGNKGDVSGLFRTQRAANHAGAAETVA
jgi:hypothetical protein